MANIVDVVLSRSKSFLRPKGIASLDQYILQMWTGTKKKAAAMKLASGDDVRSLLGLSASSVEVDNALTELKRVGAIYELTVDDPQSGAVIRLFAMPECIPLYEALTELGTEELSASDLGELYADCRRASEDAGRELVVKRRIQVHLSENGSALTAKMAVFAMFLLLAGAVSEETALVLKQRDSKEYQYQAKIVEYLNYVGVRLYGSGYSGNPKKEFKVGTLMDDFERRGQLEKQFGSELFRWKRLSGPEGVELYYFDLSGSLGEDDSLSYVLRKLLYRIREGSNVRDFPNMIKDLIKTFWFMSPIEYRLALFGDEAQPQYHEALNRTALQLLDDMDAESVEDDCEELDEQWQVQR